MSEKEFSFEEAMERLEEIVRILEGGKTSLSDSMKLYEEGVGLVREANELLINAKQKLINVGGNGQGDE